METTLPPTIPSTTGIPPLAVEACPAGQVLVGDEAFDALQPALDAAEPGDVVAVCAGTWTGAFVVEAPITLGGVGAAVLDAEGAGSVLTVPPGTTVLDLVLTGGRADRGGGLRLAAAGELTVARVTVTGNHADEGGGLWIAPGSSAEVLGSQVDENTALAGAGVWIADGELRATGSTYTGNVAADDGGGFYADQASISGGHWASNVARRYGGGGVLLESEASAIEVTDGEARFGGGLYAVATEVRASLIARNLADEGGGVYAVAGLTLTDTWIRDHEGTAITVAIDQVDVVGGAVLGNGIGAGSDGGLGQVLTSDGTDWGDSDPSGATDVVWGLDPFAFGADASFVCADGTCQP